MRELPSDGQAVEVYMPATKAWVRATASTFQHGDTAGLRFDIEGGAALFDVSKDGRFIWRPAAAQEDATMLVICSWCDHVVDAGNNPTRPAASAENKGASHGCCNQCKAMLDAGKHPMQQLHRECSGLMNDAPGG